MKCKEQRGLLFRGMCRSCAPDLHEANDAVNALMGRIMAEFEAETGESALSSWRDFELFFLGRNFEVRPEEARAMEMLSVLEETDGRQN